MSEYEYRKATIVAPWFPEDKTHEVRLSDGTMLPAMMLDLNPHLFDAGDPVVVAIRSGRAFILGRQA